MKILVSACLLGEPCRYDGESRPCARVIDLQKEHTLIPVCPECAGGLPVPRPACERKSDGSVRTADGKDRTAEYALGAELSLMRAKHHGCTLAILKSRSPACGVGRVYDGSFTRTLTDGDGALTELLKKHGVAVYTEESFPL
jgi:uncharacterized protein YbbK (DUF523 family)